VSVLAVSDLAVEFRSPNRVVRAVNGVSFTLDQARTLAIVGESGSGKSVTSLAITRLLPRSATITRGHVELDGRSLLDLDAEALREVRGRQVGMVFQDPLTSLNPVIDIETQMSEGLRAHERISQGAAREQALTLLRRVGIPDAERRIRSYPHQLSGGMRQRVMIAAALTLRPRVLIADEPTTALDVTIQAQVLELIKEVTSESRTAVLLITHDLGVVADMAGSVAVMYAGRIVEQASTDEIYARPRHPYTIGLLGSVARLDRDRDEVMRPIEGNPPDPARLPPGCPFRPRCRWAIEVCADIDPPLIPLQRALATAGTASQGFAADAVLPAVIDEGSPGHLIACHNPATPEEARDGAPASRGPDADDGSRAAMLAAPTVGPRSGLTTPTGAPTDGIAA
jgi:oligopeptide/dipeptide ABC transporter ATP-binding protein